MKKIKVDDKEMEITDNAFYAFMDLYVHTRDDDASGECYFDYLEQTVKYINPYNRNQSMYYTPFGFGVDVSTNKLTGKERSQILVWKKIKSINELKKGDFIKLNYTENLDNEKGIIVDVNYKTGCVTLQYFEKSDVSWGIFELEYYNEAHKVFYLGDDFE